ncbi:hypothetical protein DW287_09100 [Haemophilus influenzae]|nr:hypothetical protein DW287_09100 [Haemophilus influenzae]
MYRREPLSRGVKSSVSLAFQVPVGYEKKKTKKLLELVGCLPNLVTKKHLTLHATSTIDIGCV